MTPQRMPVENTAEPTVKYINPWADPRGGDVYYEHNCPLILIHRDVRVYKIHPVLFDFVQNGCCITQCAGVANVGAVVDGILNGRTPVCTRVAEHLRAQGYATKSYDDVNAEWEGGIA